jgi:hypothetical protein
VTTAKDYYKQYLARYYAPAKKPRKQRDPKAPPHPLSLSESAEHYTPPHVIELVHATLGWIDVDPCSSDKAQKMVQAKTYWTKKDDGLTKPWMGKVFINPPGNPAGTLPKVFWSKLQHEIAAGHTKEFIWLGFNIAHLRTLQPSTLLARCSICVPVKRMQFIADDKPGKHPTKDNVLLYWGPQHARFLSVWRRLGQCWAPWE